MGIDSGLPSAAVDFEMRLYGAHFASAWGDDGCRGYALRFWLPSPAGRTGIRFAQGGDDALNQLQPLVFTGVLGLALARPGFLIGWGSWRRCGCGFGL